MNGPGPAALDGVTVVVTRPADQGRDLCRAIAAQGGRAVNFPALEIQPVEDNDKLKRLWDRLGSFDLAIFVSRNAVTAAAQHLKNRWPARLSLAAVGKSTAHALQKQWGRPVIAPKTQYNSEALLALPELQSVRDKRIVIFRGEGGRDLLANELSRRGANVEYAEVYLRTMPDQRLDALRQHDPIDIIVITSNEGLTNLLRMAGTNQRAWLLDTPLVVISQRTAALATELGFKQPPWVADKADDNGLLAAIIAWNSKRHNH